MMKNEIIERLNENMCEFRESLNSLGRSKLIDMAARITAVTEAHSFFTTQYEWSSEYENNFVLLFKNPLMIIADAWEEKRAEDMEYIDVVMWEAFGNEGVLSEYPLATDTCADDICGLI